MLVFDWLDGRKDINFITKYIQPSQVTVIVTEVLITEELLMHDRFSFPFFTRDCFNNVGSMLFFHFHSYRLTRGCQEGYNAVVVRLRGLCTAGLEFGFLLCSDWPNAVSKTYDGGRI